MIKAINTLVQCHAPMPTQTQYLLIKPINGGIPAMENNEITTKVLPGIDKLF